MANLFTKHYTRAEARALLPVVRQWLAELSGLRRKLIQTENLLENLMTTGQDAGGPVVNNFLRALIDTRTLFGKFKECEIQIKDIERGLIDFPAIIADREVFLCWENGEDDIEFWHDLDSGYSGREAL